MRERSYKKLKLSKIHSTIKLPCAYSIILLTLSLKGYPYGIIKGYSIPVKIKVNKNVKILE